MSARKDTSIIGIAWLVGAGLLVGISPVLAGGDPILSVTREGDSVLLRECVSGTTQADLQSQGGCKATRELRLSDKDFKARLQAALPQVLKDPRLSPEHKTLLAQALETPPASDCGDLSPATLVFLTALDSPRTNAHLMPIESEDLRRVCQVKQGLLFDLYWDDAMEGFKTIFGSFKSEDLKNAESLAQSTAQVFEDPSSELSHLTKIAQDPWTEEVIQIRTLRRWGEVIREEAHGQSPSLPTLKDLQDYLARKTQTLTLRWTAQDGNSPQGSVEVTLRRNQAPVVKATSGTQSVILEKGKKSYSPRLPEMPGFYQWLTASLKLKPAQFGPFAKCAPAWGPPAPVIEGDGVAATRSATVAATAAQPMTSPIPQIQCMRDHDQAVEAITRAQSLVTEILDTVTSSHDSTAIGYLALDQALTHTACTPGILKSVGDQCTVETKDGPVVWQLEADGALRDLKSGIVVSKLLDTSNQHEAEKLCPAGMHLPTGYREEFKGKKSGSPTGHCPVGEIDRDGACFFPNQDSEWVTLRDNGLLEVAPDLDYWYWSSSADPDDAYGAFVFNGSYGYISISSCNRDHDHISVRCVSGR